MIFPRIRLHLRRIIGEGEQGRVYEAMRFDPTTKLRQTVAVKILHSRNAVDLWRKEFSSLADVRSPYCVRVLSFERVRGRPALVLEFVRGVSLTEWRRAGLGNEDAVAEILAQVHQGLVDLRDQGSYHGDLSPNNVMVDDRGGVRLLDFGLANGHGEDLRCTPEFAAPERLRGVPPDYEADLYSLGRLRIFLGGTHDPDLLEEEPRRRIPPDDLPRFERRLGLAQTITRYLLDSSRGSRWSTQTFARKPPRLPPKRLAAVVTAIVALNVSASGPERRPTLATLDVRTKAWHHLRIDGQDYGYAPIAVPLSTGDVHVIEWSNASGQGRKSVRLEPRSRLRLGDADFAR